MKKRNIPRIIWVSCLFLILIIILYLVIQYKVYYQYLTHNKIYFYECEGNLCVSEVKEEDKLLYSSYDCGYEECPMYTKDIENEYVLLKKQKNSILYNYRTKKVISQEYEDYQFIDPNYIIVTRNNYQGIINIDNLITVPLSYEKIGIKENDYLSGYNVNSIIAQKNKKYGIISYKTGEIIEKFQYTEEQIPKLLSKLDNNNPY